MSSGGNGRNDVEFSIGADNAPLESDLKDAGKGIENFADEGVEDIEKLGEALGKVGDAADEAAESTEGIGDEVESATSFSGDLSEEFGRMGEQVEGLMEKWAGTGALIMEAVGIAQQYYEIIIAAVEEHSGLNDAIERSNELEKELIGLNKDRLSGIASSKNQAEIQAELNRVKNEEILLEEKLTKTANRAIELDQEAVRIREQLQRTSPFGRTSADLQTRLGEIEGGGVVGQLLGGLGGKGQRREAESSRDEIRALLKEQQEARKDLEKALGKIQPAEKVEKVNNDQLDQQKEIAKNTAATAEALKNLKTGMKP